MNSSWKLCVYNWKKKREKVSVSNNMLEESIRSISVTWSKRGEETRKLRAIIKI